MTNDSGAPKVRRREFLKVLGAGGAAAAATGCLGFPDRVPTLVTYSTSPDETTPGVSTYYATTCRECSAACGVIAETRDGRTIKLEGNPEHPLNRGALCARGQAALQGLYNPDRFRGPMIRRNGALRPATWDEALTLFAQRLGEVRGRGGAGGAVFINQHETGSFPAFLDEWLAAFGLAPHVSHDAEADSAVMQANRSAYGVAWPALDFSAARLVVSIGADFLDTWGAMVPQQLDWADARAKAETAPRLVYVGARRSLTGLNADEWVPCRPGSELAVVNALAGRSSVEDAAQQSAVPPATLQRLRAELAAARPSLVLAGSTSANALEVALAVTALNQSLGNVGTTIRPDQAITSFDGMATDADVLGLVDPMKAGAVALFMVRGANPVYTLPKAAGFADALKRVPFKVSFSSYPDETTELCDLVLPDHHSLEQWGDAQPRRGVVSLQQPTMNPVFDTRATADVLIAVAKRDPTVAARYPMADYRAWLMSRFPGGVPAFTTALARGVAPGTVAAASARRGAAPPRGSAPGNAPPALQPAREGEYYLMLYPSPVLGDGRGGNKPWLQELSDPVTKISWQSWVEMHPSRTKRLGLEPGDIVTVRTPAGSISAPVFPYLGIHPDVVAMALGRGHTAYGRYAKNIGVNPLDLLGAPAIDTRGGGAIALTATTVRVETAGDYTPLVTTEGSARQHGRGIAQAVLVTDLGRGGELRPAQRAEPERLPGDASHAFLPGLRSPVAADAQGELGAPTAADRGKEKGMYRPDHWSGMAKRRWAMTIDLARCTGCSACITACHAENNIPTVGAPWQTAVVLSPHRPGFNITRGREMQWIRLERYFEGADHADTTFEPDFEARFIPMLCQHCGNAPCEPVCPVFATYHAPDGLNVQVYNRCVGTRYCSNNCPYKVRYFNWFGYGEPARPQYAFPEPLNWQLNPDVTVRGKGVMEKCTFCVQRIREAETRAKVEGRELQPDEFTTACAQACPSRAITFGDVADARWSVARLAEDRRAYHVLEELNTFTAVVYLKKVNHPAPAAGAPSAPRPT